MMSKQACSLKILAELLPLAIGHCKIKHERISGFWVRFYQKVNKKENFFWASRFGARLKMYGYTVLLNVPIGQLGNGHEMVEKWPVQMLENGQENA